MRILFASPARDLLECYKRILEADSGETVTAFDGTQVLSLISSEKFDVVVLDCGITRIDFKKLVGRMRSTGLPVIALSNRPVTVRDLTDGPPANAYLCFPFDPPEITKAIKDTVSKSLSGERLDVFGLGIDVSSFRITDGPCLAGEEIDVLKTLLDGGEITTDDGACVSALNAKFAAVGSKARIKYRTTKGFELVNDNE